MSTIDHSLPGKSRSRRFTSRGWAIRTFALGAVLLGACSPGEIAGPSADPEARETSSVGPVPVGMGGVGPQGSISMSPGPLLGPADSKGPRLSVQQGVTAIAADLVSLTSSETGHLLWQNTSTGDRGFWPMSGVHPSGGWMPLTVIATNWQVACTADFDNDGYQDILWWNSTSGDYGFWLMNGTVPGSRGYVPLTQIATNWKVVACADASGDSKPDLLWKNSTTGDLGFWIMDGTGPSTTGYVPLTTIDNAWQVAALADFTGDGKPDILWQNLVTGDRGFWPMNGTAPSGGWLPLTNIAGNWNIRLATDANGDAKPDILWHNTTTGDRGWWLMNGTVMNGSGYTPLTTIANQWDIAGLLPARVNAFRVRTWVGGASGAATSWDQAANWYPAGVPQEGDTVAIPAAASQPVLNAATTIARLTVNGGVTLTLNTTLAVTGGMSSSGTIAGGGQLLLAGGRADATGQLPTTVVSGDAVLLGGGPLTFTGNLTLRNRANLWLNGKRMTMPAISVQDSATLTMASAADTLDLVAEVTTTNPPTAYFENLVSLGQLSAGVMRVKGNLQGGYRGGSFVLTGTRLVINGAADQSIGFTVTAAKPALLADVVIDKPAGSKATFTGLAGSSSDGYIQAGSMTVVGGELANQTTLTLQGGLTAQNASVVRNTGGIFTVGGALAMGAQTELANTATLTLLHATGMSGVAGAFTDTQGTVILHGNTAQQVALRPALSFNNLVLSGGSQLTLGSTLSTTGTLTLRNTSNLTLNGKRVAVGYNMFVQDSASLTMTNAADTLDMIAEATPTNPPTAYFENRLSLGVLNAGVIRVKGHLQGGYRGGSFALTGTKLVVSGTADQSIGFTVTAAKPAYLTDVVIDKPAGSKASIVGLSGSSYDGYVQLSGPMTVVGGALENRTLLTLQGGLTAQNASVVRNFSYFTIGGALSMGAQTELANTATLKLLHATGMSGVAGAFTDTQGTVILHADVAQQVALRPALSFNNFTLSGSAQLSLASSLTTTGTLTLRNKAGLTLNGQRVTVGYNTFVQDSASLTMANAADTLDLTGEVTVTNPPRAYFENRLSLGQMSAGVIRVKGHLQGATNGGSFALTGTRLVIDGAGDQSIGFTVTGTKPAYLAAVVIDKPAASKVTFTGLSGSNADGYIQLSGGMTLVNGELVTSAWLINSGAMTVQNASIVRTNAKMTISGALTTTANTYFYNASVLRLLHESKLTGVLGGFSNVGSGSVVYQ